MQQQVRSTWRAFPPALAREDCTVCRGTGWQLLPAPGSPSARRCACRMLCRLIEFKDRVRIPDRYEQCTLDNFEPTTLSQQRALAEARKYVESYPHNARDLFFAGGPGVGKTHLAVGIVRELLKRFHDDIVYFDFCSLSAASSAGSGPELARWADWERARQASLLLLDNFGMLSPSDETGRKAGELLRARLSARRWTIYTGEPLRQRFLFGGGGMDRASSAEKFLAALSPSPAMDLLNRLKVVSVSGEKRNRGRYPIFPEKNWVASPISWKSARMVAEGRDRHGL